MSVRLPSDRRYVAAIEKEHAWLPRLAPHLPLPIPAPLAIGAPGDGYPWPWSINRWLEGEPAAVAPIDDLAEVRGGPGGVSRRFSASTQRTDRRPGATASGAAGRSRPTTPPRPARGDYVAWRPDRRPRRRRGLGRGPGRRMERGGRFLAHGDIAPGYLLVREGRLSAVIDFGQSCVGDPAATSPSPGPTSPARAARRSALDCRSTPLPGLAGAAGVCGRP